MCFTSALSTSVGDTGQSSVSSAPLLRSSSVWVRHFRGSCGYTQVLPSRSERGRSLDASVFRHSCRKFPRVPRCTCIHSGRCLHLSTSRTCISCARIHILRELWCRYSFFPSLLPSSSGGDLPRLKAPVPSSPLLCRGFLSRGRILSSLSWTLQSLPSIRVLPTSRFSIRSGRCPLVVVVYLHLLFCGPRSSIRGGVLDRKYRVRSLVSFFASSYLSG